MRISTTIVAGLLGGLTLAACDLDMKDLGDETETSPASDGGDSAGDDLPIGPCEPGDQMPAPDGCNSCSCSDNGQWACTAIGCDPTDGPPSDTDGATDGGGGDGSPPGTCEPGDSMPAPDGCNTCSCTADGQWACTAIGCDPTGGPACEPGDQIPAPDGCNTCTCDIDGNWGCSEIDCGPGGTGVQICEAIEPDYASITAASLVGDELHISVSYGGGCVEHDFGACWDGLFAESFPVQTSVTLSHMAEPDPCDAIVSEDLVISVLPLRDAYEMSYPGSPGQMIIHLTGWDESFDYSW